MQQKIAIKNKKGLTIRGIREWQVGSTGQTVVLCHGLGVTHQQLQIKLVAEALAREGYDTYRFTSTNSIGGSDGSMLNFTVGGYINDIREVINYALKKTGHTHCILAGYSIGAMASYIITASDKRINRLILQGPVYNLRREIENGVFMPLYKALGWMWRYTHTYRRWARIGYNFYKEGIKYKPDYYLKKIKCPTLVVYGTKEKILDKDGFRSIYNILTSPKKLVEIKDGGHTLRGEKRINILSKEVINWLNDK
ncbi:MAG: alpha/beta fold hydrolase [Patescibacteria group bacterium]|jgi:hypothetical protein